MTPNVPGVILKNAASARKNPARKIPFNNFGVKKK